jgi:hypothetical protein
MRRRRVANTIVEELERRYFLDGTFDVPGVQPAALDQPRVNVLVSRTPGNSNPIEATDPDSGDSSFDIQAFLDTGTSSDLLSQETSSELGVNNEQVNGQDVIYADTGVAGDVLFNVSEPLYPSIAPFSPVIDGTDASTYTQSSGPFRFEVNPNPIPDPDLEDPIDIVGMPVMQGKVMVMDPKPVDGLDLMNTYIYDPGTKFDRDTQDFDPGIPFTPLNVKLSYSDFSRFTSIDPSDAQPPDGFPNPMIGPDPVAQLDGSPPDNTPPVTIGEGDLSTTGSFLLDTGSAASFISTAMALQVGVSYVPDTYGSDNPQLEYSNGGGLVPSQFTLDIGDANGNLVTVAGFYLSSLTLQTTEGTPIRFLDAPVLVTDITVQDPNTGEQLTLDGDFGMNYMVASISLDDSGGLGGARGTPWDWVTYDQANGLLGFTPSTGTGNGATIVNEQLFYNSSDLDGNGAVVTAADDDAVADKTALQPGQTASFGNYSSYSKGINGIMIDMEGVPDATQITANDFSFAVGNSSDLSSWTALAAKPTVTVEPGAQGLGFVDRIALTWPDNTISNEWLQITVLGDANTNLPGDDISYFGNAPGETGNSPSDAAVNVFDLLATRHNLTVSADVTNNYDFNRDGQVDVSDLLFVRSHQTDNSDVLNLISPPPLPGGSPSLGAQSRTISQQFKLKIDMAAMGMGQLATTLPTITSASQAVLNAAIATASTAPLYELKLPSSVAQALPIAQLLVSNSLPPTKTSRLEPFNLKTVVAPQPADHPLDHAALHKPKHLPFATTAPKIKPPFSEVKLSLQPIE